MAPQSPDFEAPSGELDECTPMESINVSLYLYSIQHKNRSSRPVYYSTSSSAAAKRPRDASCLSVVSFNSTKRRVESFIVSYVSYRFITACS